MDMFPTQEAQPPAAPGAEAKTAEVQPAASVEVVFPHDHG
jgi:hypothetical protein